MLGYLSVTAFLGKLFFDIIMWIVILIITFFCIRRNPTDFDTNYRKRNRTVLGMLCFISAVGFLFLDLVLPEEVTLRNYFLSIFGTFTPNETMIQYGMGPNVPIREVGVKSVFALPTLEQWLVLRKVSNFALMSALGIMCLFYKKSSTRIISKVRKVLGYISLLFLVPAAFDSFHYFDFEEFIFVAVVCLITWLLLRTYRKDAKIPSLPTESIQYGENKDFAPIQPDTEVILSTDNSSSSRMSTKSSLLINKMRQKRLCNMLNSSGNAKTIILLIMTALFAISFLVFNSYRGYYIKENYEREWRYDPDCDVWFTGHWWRQSQGTRMNKVVSLYHQSYYQNGNTIVGHGKLPQYYRLFSYITDDSVNYISNQIVRLEQRNVVWKSNVFIDQYGKSRNQLVFWDYEGSSFYFTCYRNNEGRIYSKCWERKHILEVCRNKVYEFIAYYPSGYYGSYDNELEDTYSPDHPNSKFFSELKKIEILLWILLLTTCLSGIVFIVLLAKKIKQEQIKNSRAYKLIMYQLTLTIIEFIMYAIIILTTSLDYNFYYNPNLIYCVTLLFVRMPLLLYVYRKIREEDNLYYLFPQWLMNFINRYTTSERPIRAFLVFIIFPLFYLCTLPCGIFALAYIIPAIIIYLLVFFIVWIVKGATVEITK